MAQEQEQQRQPSKKPRISVEVRRALQVLEEWTDTDGWIEQDYWMQYADLTLQDDGLDERIGVVAHVVNKLRQAGYRIEESYEVGGSFYRLARPPHDPPELSA